MKEFVILVDKDDNGIGIAEKMEAHEHGVLHRAFSIFVFNSNNELLLQKRADSKYHSPGLWTNTCCSHPRPGEPTEEAAHRRLQFEMGFDCPLEEKFCFTYKKTFTNKLTENEIAHVFFGAFDGEFYVNLEEVSACKWVDVETLKGELVAHPKMYSYWLQKIFLKEWGKSIERS